MNKNTKPTVALAVLGVAALMTLGNLEAAPAPDPGGHTRKGVAAAKAKDWEKAVAEFTKAIAAQPADAKNYSNRGEVYKITGKLKEAQDDFTKAIELNLKNDDALIDRGQIFLRLKT